MGNPPERRRSERNGDERGPVRSELLREVNERIREVGRNGDGPVSGLEFVCECGGGDCVEMVELTTGEYDGIRLGSDLVLADGHVGV
jgi:hypothetical protein